MLMRRTDFSWSMKGNRPDLHVSTQLAISGLARILKTQGGSRENSLGANGPSQTHFACSRIRRPNPRPN
jgi:hypothetical protein